VRSMQALLLALQKVVSNETHSVGFEAEVIARVKC